MGDKNWAFHFTPETKQSYEVKDQVQNFKNMMVSWYDMGIQKPL